MIIYHGSYSTIEKTVIQIIGFYKDFGYAFYCANIERQDKRWALNNSLTFKTSYGSAYYEPSYVIARAYYEGRF